MGTVRWVAALVLCEEEIQSIEPNKVTVTLASGKKKIVPVFMLDDEHVSGFSPAKALEAYNKINNIKGGEYETTTG